jgi:hypothetical protein
MSKRPDRIALIVTNASPLLTLSNTKALDTLLTLNMRIIIPDMVRFEVIHQSDNPGTKEVLDWIRKHDLQEVFVGSTEVFEEFSFLSRINPLTKSQNRGECAAAEILDREIAGGVEAALLLFEDSDLKKSSFHMRIPPHVLPISVSSLPVKRAGILNREEIPMHGAEDLVDSFEESFPRPK